MKISTTNGGAPVGEMEQFAYLKELGFDACDFSLGKYFYPTSGIFGDINNVTDAQIKERFTALRKAAEAADFEIGQTHSQFTGHPRNYDMNLDDLLKREIACIKATHYLGCKYMICHPIIKPGRRYDLLVKEAFDEAIDFYKKLIPYLEEYDVICCVENMWVADPVYHHICSTIFSHAQEMVDACNILGERFKICLDVGHCPLTQDDPVEAVKICGDKLVCLHTHDNSGWADTHTLPFQAFGNPVGVKAMRIDWDGFMKALKKIGYKGNLSFELTPPGPVEIRRDGYIYLKEMADYMVSVFDNYDPEAEE